MYFESGYAPSGGYPFGNPLKSGPEACLNFLQVHRLDGGLKKSVSVEQPRLGKKSYYVHPNQTDTETDAGEGSVYYNAIFVLTH